MLDAKNYSHPAIVAKLRRVFPELRGTLTPLMIDKQLRILDQNVELHYWRTNHRAYSMTSRTDDQIPTSKEVATPTKPSKASRFMDAVLGKKPEPRAAAKGLGMRFRFDRE